MELPINGSNFTEATMSREHYGAEFRAARRGKAGAMLLHVGVAATVAIASAVSGAAVALHLVAAPPAGQYLSRSGGVATPVAIPAAPVEKAMMVDGALLSTAQATTSVPPAIVLDPAVTDPTTSVPSPARPLAERELTFAWGYALRHPGAPARQPEIGVVPALASTRKHGAVPKRGVTSPAERQRASVAQRQVVALAPSGFFPGFDGDARHALGYAEERRANAVRFFSRGNPPPSPRHRNSPSLRNHEQTRS